MEKKKLSTWKKNSPNDVRRFKCVFVVSMYFGCVFNCFQRTALFLRNMYLVVSASQELLARHMLAGVDLVAPG